MIGDHAQRRGSAFAFFEGFFAIEIYVAEFGGAFGNGTKRSVS